MIPKLIDLNIKPLNRISPSQYYSATNCPYKLVLANSFGYKPLLPLNANAQFGSITHKMIELISKGVISDEHTFSETWSELITKKETELKEQGLESITPLKYFVTDFALKKNQIRNILKKRKEKINLSQKNTVSKYYPEKRLENEDKSITGIADLVIEHDSGAVILDFKTGKIYSDAIEEKDDAGQIIKIEYEIQLKLYAHLYFLMTGKYPTRLYLVTLSSDFIEVVFHAKECEKIYSEALVFLSKTNSLISENNLEELATPSKENCKYCSYRPACNFYSIWLTTNFEIVNDLYGTIEKVNQFNNNTLGIQLSIDRTQVLINGLNIKQKEDFESLIGKSVILFNLKKTKQSLNATANNFTMVYEL